MLDVGVYTLCDKRLVHRTSSGALVTGLMIKSVYLGHKHLVSEDGGAGWTFAQLVVALLGNT